MKSKAVPKFEITITILVPMRHITSAQYLIIYKFNISMRQAIIIGISANKTSLVWAKKRVWVHCQVIVIVLLSFMEGRRKKVAMVSTLAISTKYMGTGYIQP